MIENYFLMVTQKNCLYVVSLVQLFHLTLFATGKHAKHVTEETFLQNFQDNFEELFRRY